MARTHDIGKRQAILESASALFMAHGVTGTSMDAIAQRANVSKPTLYSHFKDKKDLFAAFVQGRCALFLDAIPARNDAGDVRANLTQMAETFLDVILSEDAVCMCRLLSGEKNEELSVLFFDAGPSRVIRKMTEYLETLHQREVLDVPNPELSAEMFLNLLKGSHHFRTLIGLPADLTPDKRQTLIEGAVSLFLKGHAL
jgi:TetR/AcrR family transcriptional regulator, mexJK operon transcriptional repressor